MNIWLMRLFFSAVCVGFLVGAASAEEGKSVNAILAALDEKDGVGGTEPNTTCADDGICNAAVCGITGDPDCRPDNCNADGRCVPGCKSDPDCPAASGDASLPSRKSDIIDCTSTETKEIDQAIGWGSLNWDEFEKTLEAIRSWPVDIKSCLKNRFQTNGKVVCEAKSTGECKIKSSGTANGWASSIGLSHRCHMCPTFLAKARALSGTENRQACYFALVTHEWGHTCHRGHKTLEIIDDEAFTFWKNKHPGQVTINYSDCGGS
jgi:hypothetical protein